MDSCDVLIAGGGPAGSVCAERLRDAGMDVVLLEKEAIPRDKVCGGWVTPAVFSLLGIDPFEYRQGRVLQPVTRFLTSVLGGPTVETVFPETVSYGIWRRQFDEFLLRRAQVRSFEAHPVRNIQWEAGEWIVNRQFRTRMLVGAGGHFCPVARHLGSRPSMETAITAQETEWEMDPRNADVCSVRGNTPELFFSPDLRGYGWCFRKQRRMNVGFGRLGREKISAQANDFCAFLQTQRCIGVVMPPTLNGHAYLERTHSTRPLVADGALLIGDAAGLAFPASGEGILPAVESGLLAAETIVKARGTYTERGLSPYATVIEERFGPAQPSFASSAAERLPSPLLRALVKRLLRNPRFVRDHLLSQWFLHLHREPLAAGEPLVLAG